jgi:hypothetical protein
LKPDHQEKATRTHKSGTENRDAVGIPLKQECPSLVLRTGIPRGTVVGSQARDLVASKRTPITRWHPILSLDMIFWFSSQVRHRARGRFGQLSGRHPYGARDLITGKSSSEKQAGFGVTGEQLTPEWSSELMGGSPAALAPPATAARDEWCG